MPVSAPSSLVNPLFLPREAAFLLGLPPFGSTAFFDGLVDEAGLRGLATSLSRKAFGARRLKSGRIGAMFGTLMFGMFGVFGPALSRSTPNEYNPASIMTEQRAGRVLAIFVLYPATPC